ncbi:MAG: hypothetical protein Kow0010_14170 [Dehalococcoidia bacterium]
MTEHPAPETPGDAGAGHAFTLPPGDALVKGVALAGLSLGALVAAGRTLRASLLFAPAALVLAGLGALAAWAAAIQLTGGEKFDDHPWV